MVIGTHLKEAELWLVAGTATLRWRDVAAVYWRVCERRVTHAPDGTQTWHEPLPAQVVVVARSGRDYETGIGDKKAFMEFLATVAGRGRQGGER